MRQIAAIVRKELMLFLSDRRSVVVGILTPILLAWFFGFLFSSAGQRDDAAKIPVLVVDADRSAVSRAVIAGLTDDPLLAVTSVEAEPAREAVRRGTAVAAVFLPSGFGEGAVRAFFGTATAPEVRLLVDPSRSTEAGLVRGFLAEKIYREASREAFAGSTGHDVLAESLRALEADRAPVSPEREALKQLLRDVTRWQSSTVGKGEATSNARGPGAAVPFTLREEAVTARTGATYNSYAHSFAGMGIQFLLFVALDFGIAFLLERQSGLWKRLRAAPLSRSTLLAGKTLAGALIGLISVSATFAFGIAVLGVRVEGSVPGFLLLLLASALMASSFGLLLAAVGRTPGTTRGLSILAVLLLVMLGGGWVPAFVFPGWMQSVTLVLPTRWAIDGLDAVVWRGADFVAGALPACGVLLGYAALFLLIARLRFRWSDD